MKTKRKTNISATKKIVLMFIPIIAASAAMRFQHEAYVMSAKISQIQSEEGTNAKENTLHSASAIEGANVIKKVGNPSW